VIETSRFVVFVSMTPAVHLVRLGVEAAASERAACIAATVSHLEEVETDPTASRARPLLIVMLTALTAIAALVKFAGFPASAAAASTQYVPLTPARLLDTRVSDDALYGTKPAGSSFAVQVAACGGVAVGAAAVVLNVTVTSPRAPGFVTIWPCSSPSEGIPFGGPVAMRLGVGGSWSSVERTRLG